MVWGRYSTQFSVSQLGCDSSLHLSGALWKHTIGQENTTRSVLRRCNKQKPMTDPWEWNIYLLEWWTFMVNVGKYMCIYIIQWMFWEMLKAHHLHIFPHQNSFFKTASKAKHLRNQGNLRGFSTPLWRLIIIP